MQAAGNIIELKGYISEGIYGNDVVEKLTIINRASRETRDLSVEGVFVEIGLQPNSEFLAGLVAVNEYNEIIIDCRTRTNIPGVFAAGDVTNGPEKQIVIAAGEGAKAALMAYEYLLHQK